MFSAQLKRDLERLREGRTLRAERANRPLFFNESQSPQRANDLATREVARKLHANWRIGSFLK